VSALFTAPQSTPDTLDLQNDASLSAAVPAAPDIGRLQTAPLLSNDDDVPGPPLHVWAQHAPKADETQDDDAEDLKWYPFDGQLNAPADSLLDESPLIPNLDLASRPSPQLLQSGAGSKQWSLEDLITQQAYSPITRPSALNTVAYTDHGGDLGLSNPLSGSNRPSGSLALPFGSTGIRIPRTSPSIPDRTPDLDDADRAADPQRAWAKYAQNYAVQNHPVIDSTTEILLTVLEGSLHKMGTGFGSLFGIRVHTDFANGVKALDLPGIGKDGVEQSFSMGSLARYRAANSITIEKDEIQDAAERVTEYILDGHIEYLERLRGPREFLEHVSWMIGNNTDHFLFDYAMTQYYTCWGITRHAWQAWRPLSPTAREECRSGTYARGRRSLFRS
jgi:hypothetical protein